MISCISARTCGSLSFGGGCGQIFPELNYILEKEELKQVFSLVNNYLDPGGIFLFDLNTEYKYKELLGDSTIAGDQEECSFIWENQYDEEERSTSMIWLFLSAGRTGFLRNIRRPITSGPIPWTK